jgi:glutathione synthase/RimK-type ligase-like ATP-grasp enzyme
MAARPLVLVVTGSDMPIEDPESPLLAGALAALGCDARVVAWDDPGVDWGAATLVLVRSTWDYTARVEDFLAWATAVEDGTALLNPAAVLRWNSHKAYLAELAGAGVPTVATELVRSGSDLVAALRRLDAGEGVVVKPAVSAGAFGTSRHASAREALPALEALVASGDALVQPYDPGIADGERSLVFLDGALSHAVVKVPGAGDFRVHEFYGGTTSRWEPTPAERGVARAALDRAPGPQPLLYARVDLVGDPSAPRVMELELIEPFLFAVHAPGSLERLASLVAERAGMLAR